MTYSISTVLFVLYCLQYSIIQIYAFQIKSSFFNNNVYNINKNVNKDLKRQMGHTAISSLKPSKTVLFAELQDMTQEEKEEIVFNTETIISKETWDFADDIYLITTTELGILFRASSVLSLLHC
jgi:hypothetical protein